MFDFLFTSESVTEGHPDKICDQISDSILDDLIHQDPYCKVAVECAVKTGIVFVFGEINTNGYSNVSKIARSVIKKIGFKKAKFGFDYQTCGVISSISQQSNEIEKSVEKGKELGAGDQGLMFGYACKETKELMPLPIMLAHKITKKLSTKRKTKEMPFLRPDGKSQITVEYQKGLPKRIHTIVVSTQHDEKISQKELKKEIWQKIIQKEMGELIDQKTIFHCNPSGSFTIGGPLADAGLTGRKIIVDTYGGSCPHGGGCFSGKDATKVDRSGAYAARYIAKNLVASGLAQKCQVQLAYAIGLSKPVSILIDTFDTGLLSAKKINEIVREFFPLSPQQIIEKFSLRKPIFSPTASYGHFGREEFPWEKTDLAITLSKIKK